MSHRKKSASIHLNDEYQSTTFMEDLEESLLTIHNETGIDAFEVLFNKKKSLNKMIQHQKSMKLELSSSKQKAKQRIVQIEQLNDKVNRQTSLLRSQIQKISDAHNISKLKMMQKIIRLKKQTQDFESKKNKYLEARVQKNKISAFTLDFKEKRTLHTRLSSLAETLAIKNELQEQKHRSLTTNKRKVQQTKNEEERRRMRRQRIHEFQMNRAQSNYASKLEDVKKSISYGQEQLKNLGKVQFKEEKHLKAAETIATKYFHSFLTSQTL